MIRALRSVEVWVKIDWMADGCPLPPPPLVSAFTARLLFEKQQYAERCEIFRRRLAKLSYSLPPQALVDRMSLALDFTDIPSTIQNFFGDGTSSESDEYGALLYFLRWPPACSLQAPEARLHPFLYATLSLYLEDGNTPMHDALEKGDCGLADFLLAYGGLEDMDTPNDNGSTPREFAIKHQFHDWLSGLPSSE